MSEKHSTVCYIFREGAFSPVREAKPFHNDFGLDLFQYKGAVYEGRTGLQFCPLKPVFRPAIPDRMKRKRTSSRQRKRMKTGCLPKT